MHTLRSTQRHHRARVLLYAVAALVAAAAIAFVVTWFAGHPGALFGVAPTAGVLTASMFVPVKGLTPQELNDVTSPSKLMCTREPYYDTQPLVSGTTTSLVYFNAIQADKTLSNAKGNGGTFPANTWFQPLWINIDYLATNVLGANTLTGKLDDLDRLVTSGRGILLITVGQTTLPPIPISYCHCSGGPIGSLAGSWTAPQQAQFGNNGTQDSGYCIANSFTIAPNTAFTCEIKWTVAPTLVSTTPFLRLSFDGNWYLPVVG